MIDSSLRARARRLGQRLHLRGVAALRDAVGGPLRLRALVRHPELNLGLQELRRDPFRRVATHALHRRALRRLLRRALRRLFDPRRLRRLARAELRFPRLAFLNRGVALGPRHETPRVLGNLPASPEILLRGDVSLAEVRAGGAGG